MIYTREQIEDLANDKPSSLNTDSVAVVRQLLAENDALRKSSAVMRDAISAISEGFITSESNGDMARYMLAVKFKNLHGLQFAHSLLHLAINASKVAPCEQPY